MYTIVVKQDTATTWSIYRSDSIGAIEWPFKRKCKKGERPTEAQVRRIYSNERNHYPIEYRDIAGNVITH